MLKWIAWNRTVLTFSSLKKELYLYETELFEIKLFMYKNGFGIK